MKLAIAHGNPLTGTLSLPGDKSISHRAALFAALSSGECQVENFLVAGVTRVMLDALTELDIAWNLNGTTLRVEGAGGQCPQEVSRPLRYAQHQVLSRR